MYVTASICAGENCGTRRWMRGVVVVAGNVGERRSAVRVSGTRRSAVKVSRTHDVRTLGGGSHGETSCRAARCDVSSTDTPASSSVCSGWKPVSRSTLLGLVSRAALLGVAGIAGVVGVVGVAGVGMGLAPPNMLVASGQKLRDRLYRPLGTGVTGVKHVVPPRFVIYPRAPPPVTSAHLACAFGRPGGHGRIQRMLMRGGARPYSAPARPRTSVKATLPPP